MKNGATEYILSVRGMPILIFRTSDFERLNLENSFFVPSINVGATLNPVSNPPSPPFSKGGELVSPFEKGGLRGIFIFLCESCLVRVSSETLLLNTSFAAISDRLGYIFFRLSAFFFIA